MNSRRKRKLKAGLVTVEDLSSNDKAFLEKAAKRAAAKLTDRGIPMSRKTRRALKNIAKKALKG